MRRNITKYIGFVLDASRSMTRGRDEMIKSYNKQIQEIKESSTGIEVKFFRSIFKMDNSTPIQWMEGTSSIPELTRKTYIPAGGTPLYDAVGNMIEEILEQDGANHPNASFMVTIFSDGKENRSRTWTRESLAERLKTLQDTGKWTFIYIGTEHDLSQATSLNIPAGNTAWFNKSPQGFAGMTGASTAGMKNYMSSNVRSTKSFYGNGLTAAHTEQMGQATIDTTA